MTIKFLTADDPGKARKAIGAAAVFTADSSTTVAQVNAWLATPVPNGGPHRLQGSLTIDSAIVIPSSTTLDATGATITMAVGATGNMLINENALTPQRSITSVSTTNGSATVAITGMTSSDVGRTLMVPDAGGNGNGPLVGIIESVTSSTAVLSEAATADTTGKTAAAYIRDHDIHIKGGIWDRGSAGVTSAPTGLSSLLLQHVDYFSVDIDEYRATSGKFGIDPRDTRHGYININHVEAPSTIGSAAVQVHGPALDLHIEYVGGHTSDDVVALTAAEWPYAQSTAGDIRDVTIGSIHADSDNANLLRILPGAGRRIDNVRVIGTVKGTAKQSGVWIGSDQTYPTTTGGTLGYIDCGTIHMRAADSTGVSLDLQSTVADTIVAAIIEDGDDPKTKSIFTNTDFANNGAIDRLVINDWVLPAAVYGLTVDTPSFVINTLVVNRPRATGTGVIVNCARGTIGDVILRDGTWTGACVSGRVSANSSRGGTINRVLVDHCVGDYGGTGRLAYIDSAATGTIGDLVVRGGYHHNLDALVQINRSAYDGVVTLDNTVVANAARISYVYGSVRVVLKNPLLDTITTAGFAINGSGTMLLSGDARFNGSFPLVQKYSSPTVRVDGRNLPVDVSVLTPQAGDMASNTNGALSFGTGSVISDGVTWKNLASPAVSVSNVQVFTASGTWTKPAGAVMVRVRCVGPGAGGGAGARGPSGTALAGGGGGGSGAVSESFFAAADLPATVAVTVGTGGTGAAGQTTDSTAGANGGNASGGTVFGAYLQAGRGGPGTGGGLAAGGNGGSGGNGTFGGSGGGPGSISGSPGGTGSGTGPAAGGGAGGGGITTGVVANAGGAGGIPAILSGIALGGTAGSGANGGAGTNSTAKGPGTGGGGGGASVSVAGYSGGKGGNYGAGGGGGGASLNGNTSGAGGDGGDGICIVTSYF